MTEWTGFNDQLFEMIRRYRMAEGSRAAATVGKDCQMIISNNPERDRTSKAASVTDLGINKIKAINDFIMSNGTRF